MSHHCHALGCKRACPPAHLMCAPCWRKVPADLQREVYATCKRRGESCDATWAPWWRAAHRAIHHVAMLVEPDVEKGARWLAHEMAVADSLEAEQ